ncbi:MAG: ATP-binding protein, partial [Verrucomicrobia bacterium]|nr:ATP-binding protein [Verrucomicrobiota bacterium]
MLTDDDLKRLARQSESDLIERKKSRHTHDVRVALVAFANSVRHGECAVLFIGIGPLGEIVGVERADENQREIRRIAEQECYPPVDCQIRIVIIDGKEVLAVLVPHSAKRPHFAGHAFVRKGSESVKSSAMAMENLIASRNDKASRLIEMIGQKVLIELRPPKPLVELNGRQAINLRYYEL